MPQSQADNTIAEDIISRYARAVTDRGTLDSHLEEIAKRLLPNYSGTFTRDNLLTPGAKKTEDMIDATAALALGRMASALESMLTPRNSRWHGLQPSDTILQKDRTVREWFEGLTDILFQYRYAPRANFASQKRADYLALSAFGTGSLYIDHPTERDEVGLRYKYIHLGEIHFLENHQGMIDTALRKFCLTARQALQRFDKEKLPKELTDDAEKTERTDKKYWFIHCIKPRSEADGYDPNRKDGKGFKFIDFYIEQKSHLIVDEGGHNVFPYSISRYDVAPGEIYGRSPAMMALPSIKLLNEQKKVFLKQGHRTSDPVLLSFDDGIVDTFSLRPGAMNAGGVSAEGKLLVQTLPTGNLAITKEMMQEEREIINDFFLISLFQILIDSPQMTATEVLERAREKGALLSPTMGRQQSEALGPQIEREIDLLVTQRLVPPMPPALVEAQGDYIVEYTSPLSRAQKAEEPAGLFRVVDWLTQQINLTGNPEPLDWIDWDGAMPEVLTLQAVPLRWQKTLSQVLALRKQRAEQAQQAELLKNAGQIGGLLKNLPGLENAAGQ